MPYLDLAVAGGLLATLLAAALRRRRSTALVWALGAVTAATAAVALLWEGPRWQLLAILACAVPVTAYAVGVRRMRSAGARRTIGILLAAVVAVPAAVAWGLPPVLVPALRGEHGVGVATTVWVDATRDARGGGSAEGERSIPATIWYPAAEAGGTRDYLPDRERADALTGALAAQFGLPAIVLDGLGRARAHASWEAPAETGSFPVVVASPGASGSRWLMRSWAEEVASHGAVVIVVDHPYDSAYAELADGGEARGETRATGDDARDQSVADRAAAVRAADLRAVADAMVAGDPLPALVAADPTRLVAAGHSLGGAAAVEAARTDERFRGVVDIDGMPRSPQGSVLARPAVFLVAGDADANPAYDDAVARLLDADGARVAVDGVAHLGFADTGLALAPVPGVTGARGSQGARIAAQATVLVLDAVADRRALDRSALAELGRVG
ncbi:hypothetical protein PFZ55_33130 [Streptomyces sp. MS2A]|nr:hypothetical protein [Streptomyces sp. MS2A]